MTFKVPLAALADDGEGGDTVAPSVGDEVTLPDVKAVVKAIDGDQAEVEVQSVAGEACDCGEPDAEPDGNDNEPTEDSLRAMAKQHDGQ